MADNFNPVLDLIQKENVSHDVNKRQPDISNPTVKVNNGETPKLINRTVKVQIQPPATPITVNEKVDRMKKISSQVKKAKQQKPSKEIVELW